MDKQVINAKIRAKIVPNIGGSVKGTINNVVKGEIRGEISRTPYVPEAFIQHLVDYDNPHKTTAEQVGAVPVDFRSFTPAPETTKGFRQTAELFVGKDGNGFRMTLQDVKNMGTKIVTVDDIKEVDFDKLDVGDYIYFKI